MNYLYLVHSKNPEPIVQDYERYISPIVEKLNKELKEQSRHFGFDGFIIRHAANQNRIETGFTRTENLPRQADLIRVKKGNIYLWYPKAGGSMRSHELEVALKKLELLVSAAGDFTKFCLKRFFGTDKIVLKEEGVTYSSIAIYSMDKICIAVPYLEDKPEYDKKLFTEVEEVYFEQFFNKPQKPSEIEVT